ncbi:ATP-binding protein [Halodesulfovibrio marinisediminis]|uniref:CO dehydrogenase maturation factor n=1 Tax=Halodesulfovibrio marinisediminis DSM 17456 TaxID=1121457 RepID=A0A1N6IRY9_9BACT|nr:AAA family ATPase [Halodesulfovibrio marinisediminis]SIO34753.1 CO dehydrogenase maturation factor [Halodesulfovibrio marinisediminis DSM 17456]
MKLAFAGKGGVGKTTLTAWMADYLARKGQNVWLVDADTALSLGEACGIDRNSLPEALIHREDLIRERIRQKNTSMFTLNPDVSDLPEVLSVELPVIGPPPQGAAVGSKRLLVMGTVTGAGGGCACAANTLLKAILAHLVLERNDWVLVDLEAGVEHLGRGTVAHVDGLVVVSEPSMRGLQTAADVGRMAVELGLDKQVLVLNRSDIASLKLPELKGLPDSVVSMPYLSSLAARQLTTGNVLGLADAEIDLVVERVLKRFGVEV